MTFLKDISARIPAGLKNMYVLIAIVFVIWMLFFDSNNLISQVKMRNELHNLEAKKQYYLDEIDKENRSLNDLIYNDLKLEKFARENYLMKKEGEDIFVIVEE